ncbi:MAG: hypothetical protein JJT75_14430, partial [Opitutales bacterium]|nr:hypothetical protein [Opitutales bacterium]
MNRDWAIEEYETILQQEDGDSNATNDFTVELIDWVHLTGDNPTQQSIDSLTMDQLLDLLNQASQELDRIKVNFLDLPGDPISGEEIAPVPGFSTYDAISLPSFGPVHHFNLSQFPIHAAKTLNELTHLEWPILRRDYETRNSDGRDDLGNSDYTPIYIGFDYYKNLGFYGDDFIRLFHSPIFSHVPSLGRYFVKEPNWRTEYSFTLPQERSFFKTKAYGWTESDFDYSIDEAADRHLARHIAYRKQIRSGFNLAIGDEDSVIEEGQIFLLHARRWNEEIIALEDAEELTETEEFHYAGYLFLHDEDVNHQQHYDYGTVPEEQIQDFSSFKIAEFHWEDLPFNTLMFGDMHSDLQVAGEWYDVEFENYELDPDGDYVSLLRRFIPSFWEYNILTLYEDIDGDYEYREHDVFPEGTEIVDGSPTNPPLETPEVELYRGTVSVVFSPKFETYFEPESIAPTILYASPERGELEISNDLLQLKIGLGRGKSKHHPGFLILEDIATPKDYSGSNLSQLISGLADPVRLRPVMLSNDFEILYAFAPGEIPDPLQWWELETPPLSDKLRSDPRWSPRIRQIIGSEVAVDIQMAEVQIDQETHLSPYEYTIKLYHSDQVGSKEDRYYTFSGEPFQTYHVETPEPDEETDLLFTITSNKQIITLEREEDEVTIKYQDKNDSSNVITHTRSSVSHISQNIISDQHETLYSAYRFVSMGNNG